MTVFICSVLTAGLTGPAAAQERTVPEAREQITLSYAPLVREVAPAVVNIYSQRVVTRRVSPFMGDPFFSRFFGEHLGFGQGLSRQQVESALGSGVIVDEAGFVITNAHVVSDSEDITVVLPDGREFGAEIVLTDEPSDLALLRVDPGDETLPYVRLRPSETLAVGDLVLAIGNPFGVGQTVTSGIVSALARANLNINDFNFFIQTDAAINPGNSGGALVAMDGGLVGINTAIFSRSGGSLGIGFAIPSEMVATVIAAAQSGQDGRSAIIRPWLGITAQRVSADIADSLGFRVPHGVLVAGLHEASPARAAGLRTGDVVLAVDGREVREPAEMKFRMATVPLGSAASFRVLRAGQERTIEVKAIAPPEVPPRNETALSGAHPLNGATIANINPALETELGLARAAGVVMTAIPSGSRAAQLARPGDIVRSVNGRDISSVQGLQEALNHGQRAGQGWEFIIERGGAARRVIIR